MKLMAVFFFMPVRRLSLPRIGAIAAFSLSLCAVAPIVAPASVAAWAQNELASPWVEGPLSRVRLIGGTLERGVWQAGVEISLKGEAHTYWRFPGDSGVPPVFNFSGSANLASVTPRFPAPERMEEAGLQVFGYRGEVIFPLRIAAQDPEKPVRVALHLTYAACEKICMPADARLMLELDHRLQSKSLSIRIADYEALAPKPASSPGAPQLRIAKSNPVDGKPAWRVSFETAQGAGADLIADGPEGWFFDTKRRSDGAFDVILAERPADAKKTPPATLTLLGEKGSFEATLDLDAEAGAP